MFKYSLLAICAYAFVFTCCDCAQTATQKEETTTETHTGSILDCITCLNKQPQLNEIIQAQKVAQRLEYIKQQLMSNLRVDTVPLDPPRLEALPGFLVDQLVNPSPEQENEGVRESHVDSKQMVLFPEEETTNCYLSTKSSICLTFTLGEALMTNFVNAAIVWLSNEKLKSNSRTQNFTIIDRSSLNAKNRNINHPKVLQVRESNGWYGLDVKDLLISWQYYKTYSFIIECDECEFVTSTKTDNENNDSATSFLLLHTAKDEVIRSKRGVDCAPGSKECCRDTLEVEFASLGDLYKMILYPAKFNAFMCRGSCFFHSVIDTEKQYANVLTREHLLYRKNAAKPFENHSPLHSNLKMNKTTHIQLPTTCCTPTKFSSLSVIYATSNTTFEKALIQNMVVEACGCV